MDARALDLRNLTWGLFAEFGRAPSAQEVAQAAELSTVEVEATWGDLHREHELVLDPITSEIRMAIPFSAVPTAYRVQAAGRLVVWQLRLGCNRRLCCPACGWSDRDVMPGLRRTDHGRSAQPIGR